ncbi:MAG: hypothetical protein FJ309_00285 [Planctomycetes bacterium]|nr:hypothetical protein [Planctomycetota bacterium]
MATGRGDGHRDSARQPPSPARDDGVAAAGGLSPATPPPLTDSGWFWGLAFALVSLVGIGLIAPKFDVRQRQIEGRFLGRQKAAIERQRRAAGLEPEDLADAARDRDDAQPGRIVPLWTLAAGALAAAAGCGAMLVRERRRLATAAQPMIERRRAR